MLPSSKTLSAMYLIPKITSNEQLNKIPEKAVHILNLKFNQWIDELSPNGDNKDE